MRYSTSSEKRLRRKTLKTGRLINFTRKSLLSDIVKIMHGDKIKHECTILIEDVMKS